MTETQCFAVAILNVIPNGYQCEIRTTDDCLIDTIKQMDNGVVTDEYICKFCMTIKNKTLLKKLIECCHAEKNMHYFAIKCENDLLFEAYDGFEIGEFYKEIELPQDFISSFVQKNMCITPSKRRELMKSRE
jgi:hypothetical protein